jgi:hypothetical protein
MKKTFKPYLIISILLFIVTRVYGLFAHGLSSLAMESTFVVALVGGILMILIRKTLNEKDASSVWLIFSYNVSLAFLINHLFIQGVLSIAGGSSSLAILFSRFCVRFALITMILWFYNRFTFRKKFIRA